MRFLSLLIGKIILGFRRLSGGGSALPGLVVEKLNPGFLKQMLAQLPQGVIVVSGTNGKTTTTKTIASLLEGQGLRVLTNKSGSNFVRGIVGAVLSNSTLGGKLPFDIAVFEQDEAHAVHFVHQVRPRGVVVLNIMRDQMDRFGEIDTTAKLLQELSTSATEFVVLNSNDERVSKLNPSNGVKTFWFGHNKDLQHSFLTDDELHHLGDVSFHSAGEPLFELTDYKQGEITLNHRGKSKTLKTALSTSHNAINLMAALTTLEAALPDLDMEKVGESIMSLQPAFGRGESFKLTDGTKITLQLVKNPGGFTHSLRMLNQEPYDVIAMAINDDYADGRDVSWLWDVDFNHLEGTKTPLICGGTRGFDMAVRLKYDGAPTEHVKREIADFVEVVNLEAKGKSAMVFCTYTAMLKIRSLYQKESSEVYGVEV